MSICQANRTNQANCAGTLQWQWAVMAGTVVVAAANHAWRIVMSPDPITVGDVTSEAEAEVTGEPSNLLLWLWGRAPDSAVAIDGDPAAARPLRDRLSLATQ